MDGLFINGLAVSCHIGCHDWEQRILQTLYIDIEIPMDISRCQDNLEKTIDYTLLCQFVQKYLEEHRFKLIEKVAFALAEAIRERFALTTLRVVVSKPNAIKNARNVSVSSSI